jgi:hypothetical protein
MNIKFAKILLAITALGSFLLAGTQSFADSSLHRKVSKLLSKHAVVSTRGGFGGHFRRSSWSYAAQGCKLNIDRHTHWRRPGRSTMTTDHGASYSIPLSQVDLESSLFARSRIKLECKTKDCISKRLHRRCNQSRYRYRRRCLRRRNKSVSAYYLKVDPRQKTTLSNTLKRLINSCGTSRSAHNNH